MWVEDTGRPSQLATITVIAADNDTKGAHWVQFGNLTTNHTDQLGAKQEQAKRDTKSTDHHNPGRDCDLGGKIAKL